MIRIYLLLIVAGVLCGVGYGVFWYYNDTQTRLAVLRENNAKLETAMASKNAAIEQLQADFKKQAELNNKLTADLQKSTEYQNTLRDKLQKHNLTLDSLKKPALIEKVINNGTEKLRQNLESITAKPAAN